MRDFLKQTAKMQGGRAILVFQQRVRYAQRLVRDWVRVRKRRMAFLRTVRLQRSNRDRSTPSTWRADGVLAEIRDSYAARRRRCHRPWRSDGVLRRDMRLTPP